jgi:hypothetical protein
MTTELLCHNAMVGRMLSVVPKFDMTIGTACSHVHHFDCPYQILAVNDFTQQLKTELIGFEGINLRSDLRSMSEKTRRVSDVGTDIENISILKEVRVSLD